MPRPPKFGGLNESEWKDIVSHWALKEHDTKIISALLHFAKVGETWPELKGRTGISEHVAIKWLTRFLSTHDFNTEIRWLQCERAHLYDKYTILVDHTTTFLRYKPSNAPADKGYRYTSGHKGVCFKYQCATTLQGTPIGVSAAQEGRRNDVFLFVPPITAHVTNDFAILDGGYPGLNGHCRIPIRKPVNREFTEDQMSFNRVLSRARSRIEREFSVVKRYALIKKTNLEMDNHSLFVRLVFLVAHVLQHNRNATGDTQYTASAADLQPGNQCVCNWRKRLRE